MASNAEADNFLELVEAAEQAAFAGWDFTYLNQRWREEALPWSYREAVLAHLPGASTLLDMGTGGGEFLAGLAPLPPITIATEAYPPNIAVAQARLTPLGVSVVGLDSDSPLPFSNQHFDLIINRHASFAATELSCALRPGGTFITQQVGGRDNIRLSALLHGQSAHPYATWNLSTASQHLRDAGLVITSQREVFPALHFYDVGAVVYYLRAIPWQVPDFSVARYLLPLKRVHQMIQTDGKFTIHSHRFFLQAQRPLR